MASAAAAGQEIAGALAARVTLLEHMAGSARAESLASELVAIRAIAEAHGIRHAIPVVQALEAALARGERGPMIQGWFAVLRDAVVCLDAPDDAGERFVAACAVRLHG